MAVKLNEIVPWGRSLREYELMMGLTAQDMGKGILDCGGGPASFAAEAAARDYNVVAVDPIYAFSGAKIQARFEATAGPMIDQVRAKPDDFVWSYHRDADDLLDNRRAALELFLFDYARGAREGRYVVGELPCLPFDSGTFGIAVCSHLLFLYSDLLSADFHVSAVRELCRVANEVRIFPLLNLDRRASPHVAVVRAALEEDGWTTQTVPVEYEFQRGSNRMLRVFKS